MEVTLNLPENVYRNFSKLAEEKQRRVEDVIADRLQNNLSVETADFEETVAAWSDDAVSALAKLQLPKETADRMSKLSDRVQDRIRDFAVAHFSGVFLFADCRGFQDG